MNDYPSTPGASSSRVTLDDLLPDLEDKVEAVAEKEDVGCAGSRGSRSRWKTRSPRIAAYVLTLCLPYIRSANALPSPVPLVNSGTAALQPQSRILSLMDTSRRLLGGAPSPLLARASNVTISSEPFNLHQTYIIPSDFVVLNQMFSPGFIVLSYLIAFVGSLCTLELLIRRTSNAGWRNQLLLSSAGICFGAVSTFSMHFIFNNALTLSHPEIANGEPLALSYASGYTVLSLVASCTAMTLAFFVMGTSVADWWCFPGSRSRRREDADAVKRQTEEYKKWKLAHKRSEAGLLKAREGIGALVGAAAGLVGKWSLIEEPGRQSPQGDGAQGQKGNSWSMGKIKKVEQEEKEMSGNANGGTTEGTPTDYRTVEDQWISRDRQLSELDFRLGRTAARLELERRAERFGTQSTLPLAEPNSRHSVEHSTYQPDSSVSLPFPATARTGYHASRRASEAAAVSYPYAAPGSMGLGNQGSISSMGMFAPGFDFPPRLTIDTIDSSTANLLHSKDSAPNSAHDSDHSLTFPRRGSMDMPPFASFDASRRRASLPAFTPLKEPSFGLASQGAPAGAAYPAYSNTLTRIQSLPEADQDIDTHTYQSFSSPRLSSKLNTPQLEQGLGKGEGEVTFDIPAEEDHLPSPGGDRPSRARSLRMKNRSRNAKNAKDGKGRERHELTGHWLLVKLEKFLGFDVVTRGEVIKIVLTGTIAGFGVAAMHYIGQLSIVGMPYIAYDPAYVVGSVLIAAGAVVIALYIMFIMLRPKLKHGFLYKICVAIILAVAVCCMHFCGMMGTTYAWPINTPITKQDHLSGTNGAIVGIVSALAFAACLACGVFFFVEFLQSRRERRRRRRVVVAAIMLDEQDRILVNSTDGLPPMCDIASLTGDGETLKTSRRSGNSGSHSSGGSTILGMDLTPGHEAFVSALKLSWFWRNPETVSLNPFASKDVQYSKDGVPVRPVLPSINTSIQEIRRGSLQTTSSTQGSRPSKISVTKFLERFVVSAGQLAVRLTGQQDGIQRLGVLYDQILTTGWVKLSHSSDTVSKGQLIILVRRIPSQEEQHDLLARHFIFADSSAVAVALQRTLSVPLEHMDPLLRDVQRFCDSTTRVSLQPGMLYAGVAVVQATPFDGLRILLEQENRSQLPMREICPFSNPSTGSIGIGDDLSGTVEEIGEALTWLEGMNLVSIIGRNCSSVSEAVGGPRVTQLLKALERAIVPMLDEMLNSEDMAHILPRLQLHPYLVPLTPGRIRPEVSATGRAYMPPYMIVLYANYDAAVNTFTDKWLPFSLFRAQNACVMAPAVAAAQRTLGPAVTQVGMPEGFNPARRPSKVQFDVPPSTGFTSPSPATSLVAELPNPLGWAAFTFPPKQEESAPPYSTSPVQHLNGNQLQVQDDSPSHPTTAVQPLPLSIPSHRLPTPRGGRRSSLAKPRDYAYEGYSGNTSAAGSTGYLLTPGTAINTLGGEKGKEREWEMEERERDRSMERSRDVEVPGVASWDAEWLLTLLRTKLRAEA